MSDERSRLWIDAVNASRERQTSIMRRALLAWSALTGMSLLALGLMIALWWTEDGAPFAWRFPMLSGCYRAGCACLSYWGASTMALPWMLAAVGPCLLVPPRSPTTTVVTAPDASPYRTNVSQGALRPDTRLWLQLRRARRRLVASAAAAGLIICACLDPVVSLTSDAERTSLIYPGPQVNGVAVLDVVIAVIIVLAYSLNARAVSSPVVLGRAGESRRPLEPRSS